MGRGEGPTFSFKDGRAPVARLPEVRHRQRRWGFTSEEGPPGVTLAVPVALA
jgi:hypothetical protein